MQFRIYKCNCAEMKQVIFADGIGNWPGDLWAEALLSGDGESACCLMCRNCM
jgi:hypothetical protein